MASRGQLFRVDRVGLLMVSVLLSGGSMAFASAEPDVPAPSARESAGIGSDAGAPVDRGGSSEVEVRVGSVQIEVPEPRGAPTSPESSAVGGQQALVAGRPALAAPFVASRSGFRNGLLPAEVLQRSATGCVLFVDAAVAYDALTAAAAAAGFTLEHSGCYRTFAEQVATRERWCALRACRFAANPGTSMHGWGLAVDFRIGQRALGYDDALYRWLFDNAPTYGFYHPLWARRGGSIPEPWHWEFAADGQAFVLQGSRRARAVPPGLVSPVGERIPA